MKNMDNVLLINLPLSSNMKGLIRSINSMPPLGLLYIGAYLKVNSIDYKIFDFAVETIKKDEFISFLLKFKPRIIGLSTYNETWESQKVISKLIKKILPECIIVAGGAFATFCYKEMFEEKIVDYVIRGEGEVAFYQLYNSIVNNDHKSIEFISGLVYLGKNGNIIVNSMQRIKELDELPYPDREAINLKNYLIPFTISTARGCVGDCIFCSSRAFWGKSIYMRSAENILKEIMYLHEKYNENVFYFSDDAFTLNKKRAIEFCEKVIESKKKFTFGFESRADVIDEQFLALLSQAGFKKIQIGLESADNNILKLLKKKVTIEQIENAIKLAYKYQMHISVSYIVGHAFDTEETVEKTLDYIRHIQKEYKAYTMVSVNTPFPGTEQYERKNELGIKIFTENPDDYRLYNPIISTNNLSIDRIKVLYERAVSISTYGNKKTIY